jgi:hypothetical protein
MSKLLPENTFPEFHFYQRFTYAWHLIFYDHNEKGYCSIRSEKDYTKREGVARDFLNRLQRRLGLRHKEMIFFASTEFGKFQKGHFHVLISFDRLHGKGAFDKIESSNASMPFSVEELRKHMFPKSMKIKCIPVRSSEENQRNVLSYVCKKEGGHDYKHFFASRFIMSAKALTTPSMSRH